jgi:plasmid stability protein
VKRAVHKNVTLSLPAPLLRKFRVYAASHNQSMTKLMAEAIRTMMDQESERSSANRRILDRMRNAKDLGTGGVIGWTREELYERVR